MLLRTSVWPVATAPVHPDGPRAAFQLRRRMVEARRGAWDLAADWTPVWISAYRANCLTLDSYRHGRVLFAGDAAHLVPIFGVRGMNSGIDDTHNLAWKLAWVVQGRSPAALVILQARKPGHSIMGGEQLVLFLRHGGALCLKLFLHC